MQYCRRVKRAMQRDCKAALSPSHDRSRLHCDHRTASDFTRRELVIRNRADGLCSSRLTTHTGSPPPAKITILHNFFSSIMRSSETLLQFRVYTWIGLCWWKGVAILPWGARDSRQSLWHFDCWLNTLYTSHCQLPDMVWSLQQVEVWPSTKEKEEDKAPRLIRKRQ